MRNNRLFNGKAFYRDFLTGYTLMTKRAKTDYFDSLANQSEYSLKASRLLDTFISKYDISDIFRVTDEMRRLRSESQKGEKNLLSALKEEFLPPIDSEDIFMLAKGISKVTAALCDISDFIYICNPYTVTDGTARLSQSLLFCVDKLHTAVASLKDYKKRDSMTACLDGYVQSKDSFDTVYKKAQKELFGETADVRRLLCFTEIHGNFRKCCDACSLAAQLLEATVMKNA